MENDNKTAEPATPLSAAQAAINTPTIVVEQETQEQINWKKFREAREIERKQREAAEKRASEKEAEAAALKAAMDALLSKNHTPIQDHSVGISNNRVAEDMTEDERIQQRVDAAFAARDKKYADERVQREQAELPKRIIETMPDFDNVCTASNIDYLEYHHPEITNAIKYMPEGYERWSTIYKNVKKFVPNTNSTKDSAKADKNFAKPQAMSIAGKTQVGDTAPQKMDDKRRQDNWSRMQRVMKGG